MPDKISGKYTYVHNVQIPGMVHGRVVRPRGQGPFGTGAPIVSVDESSIKHIPGAQRRPPGRLPRRRRRPRVRRDPGGRAAEGDVEGEPDAARPRATSSADAGPTTAPASRRRRSARTPATSTPRSSRRRQTISATYKYHYGGRAVIGPSCAVADVRGDSATIYSSSQNLLGVVTAVAGLLGHPGQERALVLLRGRELVRLGPERVGVVQGGGAHVEARRQAGAHAAHALGRARLGLLPGRADLSTCGPASTRAASSSRTTSRCCSSRTRRAIDVTSELTGAPYPTTMTGRADRRPERRRRVHLAEQAPDRQDARRLQGLPQRRVAAHRRRGAARGVRVRADDRRARLRGEDGPDRVPPEEHHRRRLADRLNAAAHRSNWQPGVAASNLSKANVVTGRGFGLGRTAPPPSSAAVVDIEVNKKTGKITVKHVYNAIDAGLAVNPEGDREPDGRRRDHGREPRAARDSSRSTRRASPASTGSRTRSCASRTRRR